MTLPSAGTLLTINAVAAVLCLLAALLLRRHLLRVDARLRSVETTSVQPAADSGWLRGVERLAIRLTPAALQATLRARIERAGLGSTLTVARFLAVSGIGGLALWGAELLLSSSPRTLLLLPIDVLGCVLVAGVLVDRRGAARRHAVQRSLPATLDLLVLAMEAGLSYDAAMREVVAEWPSPASREFERIVSLTQLGLSRREAMLDVADNLGLDSFRRLASRLGTAERLGSSMVLIMRAEADEARQERRDVATRRVAQAPIKILLPTAFLILPVTMIVVLGPAVPQLLRVATGS